MMCQTYYLPRDTIFNLYIQGNSVSCPSYAFPSPYHAYCITLYMYMCITQQVMVYCLSYHKPSQPSCLGNIYVHVAQAAEHRHRNESGGCMFHCREIWWLRVLFNFARFLLSIYDDRKKHHLNQHSETHTELP